MKSTLTVFKASAGSGKTFTLTAQYIALLLSGELSSHRSILAVTFTNKATAEMKERILQELWAMAYQPASSGGFFNAVKRELPGVPEDVLQKRAAVALHAIVHDYDYFRIETIDAFFQSLLATLAHELGLSAGFRVEINDGQVIDAAVRRLIASLPERADLQKWVLDYIGQRISENQRWDISKEVKKLARQIMKERFLLHEEKLLPVLEDPAALSRFRKTLKSIDDEAKAKLCQAAVEFDENVSLSGGYARFNRGGNIEKYVRGLQNGETKEPSASMRGYMEDSRKWLKKSDWGNEKLCATAVSLSADFAKLGKQREETAYVSNSCTLTLRYLNPLRLIGEIGRTANAINEENNRFMLAKTPLLFSRLVGSEDASFVFEKVGTAFQHVMIDEFQDTSTLQWGNFKKLLVENMSQGNGCLLVGDVKQSIYRFRNGDWKILEGIENEFHRQQVTVHTLDTNYRSARNIVSFVNDVFPRAAQILDELDENGHISGIYADVRQKDCGRPGGCVEVRYVKNKTQGKQGDESADETENEVEIPELLAGKIRQLHNDGLSYADMAVLVRYNNMARGILDVFSEQYPDIPLISDEAFVLSASPEIQLLVHALRWLDDAADTVSMACVAKTWQGFTEGADDVWTQIISDCRSCLPKTFVEERDRLAQLPLYELCERLLALFGLEKRDGAAPYLFCFMDEVMNWLETGSAELGDFLTYWDETLSYQSIPAGEVEGVRILTIHKSKG